MERSFFVARRVLIEFTTGETDDAHNPSPCMKVRRNISALAVVEEREVVPADHGARGIHTLVDQAGNQRVSVLIFKIGAKVNALTFIVEESGPLWEPLISILPEALPRTALVETWKHRIKGIRHGSNL